MAGGSQGDNIGLKEEVIKKACSLAFKAHKAKELYLSEKFKTSSESYHIISFPGSWVPTDWFVSKSSDETKKDNKPFGQTKVDLALFPSLRSVGNDEAALVNEAFLKRFDRILKNSSIKSEVNRALSEGKQVVFTGHSSGAAEAIFATFWALEEYRVPIKNQQYRPPLCVTFGSPLVGNHIFSHASRRENWSHYFIHFVMRFDIVPRILLAPFSSIEQNFGNILQSLTPKSKSSSQDSISDSVTSEFYSTVMRSAATVTTHAACKLMGSVNLLLETVTNFVELSPYRPFGTYIFCNGNGQLVVIRNSDAVLQLLLHTALLTNSDELPRVAKESIQQHQGYEGELLKMKNVVYLNKLDELPLSADDSNSEVAKISTALDGLGLSTRARLCLRAAGELENQKIRNENKIKEEFEKKAIASMEILEKYKRTCKIHNGYYDAFKVQKEANDFQANVNRLVLAGVWDEIIEMLKRYELPDEFEGNQGGIKLRNIFHQWITLGTEFRRLVEPLDIANYYRHLKNEDTGPYIIKARPKRYRYTQRWLEHANRWRQEDFSESSFWAEVEELGSWMNNKKPFDDVKERVSKLEQNINKWTAEGKLSKEVFSKDPTFIKLWGILSEEHKAVKGW